MIKILFFIFLLLVLVFLLGPKPGFEQVDATLPEISVPLAQLDSHIRLKESLVEDIKPGCEARIIWNDTLSKVKTDYVLLYLHGFSATAEEGSPVHKDFGKRYGMNVYLPRLNDHGRVSENSFEKLTPKNYMESATDALAIANALGEKVVVMACSTGATLAVYLAAKHPDLIHSLILYSPNIDLYDPNSRMLTWPWGKQILAKLEKGNYHHVDYSGSNGAAYWNTKYHTNGLIALKGLINQTMTKEVFSEVKQPILMCSYYKDEEEHDKVVSHKAMDELFQFVGTDTDEKRFIKFPDVIGHVFTSYVFSEDYKKAFDVSTQFAEEVLGFVSKESIIKDALIPEAI